MRKHSNNKNGFTLIEILVVVVIMGIILAVGIPTTGHVYAYVKKSDCLKNQNILVTKIEAYKTGDFPYMDQPNKSWTAGSYDPVSKTWDGAQAKDYYDYRKFNETNGKYESGSWPAGDCDSMKEGERFLRYAYNYYDSPADKVLFPASKEEGCQLYIVYYKEDDQIKNADGTDSGKTADRNFVEIHCALPEHNSEEPLRVYFME